LQQVVRFAVHYMSRTNYNSNQSILFAASTVV